MTVLELYAKHIIGECFDDCDIQFDCSLFCNISEFSIIYLLNESVTEHLFDKVEGGENLGALRCDSNGVLVVG